MGRTVFAQVLSGGGKVSRKPSESSAQELGPAGETGLFRVDRRKSTPDHKDVRIKGPLEPSSPPGGSNDGPIWPGQAKSLRWPEGNGHDGIPGTGQKASDRRKGIKAACGSVVTRVYGPSRTTPPMTCLLYTSPSPRDLH